jgi:S1-C subfamily serine protease
MLKILIPFIAALFLLPACVDKNEAKRNLERTLVAYENSLLRKNFKAVVDFIPDEVIDGMIDQSHVSISREELRNQVIGITEETFAEMKDLDFKFSEIGDMVEHGDNIFFRVRSEVSGNFYLEELDKTYDFWSKGFVVGISKDKGETFHLVNYEDEKTKTILDNVYDLVTPKLKLSYSANNTQEMTSQMMADYNQAAEFEARSKINTLYETYKQAVFKLVVSDKNHTRIGSGTGFVMGDFLITNNHVLDVEGIEWLEVFDHSGAKIDWGEVYDMNENYDYAILKLPEGNSVPTFPSHSDSQHPVGEEVFTIGNPAGSASFTLTRGLISGLINRGYQIDNDVFFGASGSPVFNEEGEVIGIVTAINSSNTASFVMDIRNLPLDRMFPD